MATTEPTSARGPELLADKPLFGYVASAGLVVCLACEVVADSLLSLRKHRRRESHTRKALAFVPGADTRHGLSLLLTHEAAAAKLRAAVSSPVAA